MPDGPSIEIRITADTGGIEAAKARLAELKSALGATQGQMIALGGGTDELRAKSAALTAQIGQTRREIAGLASAAQDSSSALSASRGGAEVAAGGLKTMEGASRGLGQELRHGIALIDEFSRGARGAMVSSLVAAARDSGYLGTAIAALKGPFGVALAGSAALAAGLYLLIERAHETEVALRGVYNASLLMGGVSPAGAELGARSAMTALGSSGVMGSSSIDKYVEAVYKLGDASDSVKQKLISIGPALYLALDKSDKEVEKFVANFRNAASVKSLIEEHGLATPAQAATVDQAAARKDYDALATMAADTLIKRLSGANAAIAQAGRTATSGLAAGLAAQSGMPPFSAEAFLPGAAAGQTRLPATPAGARPQAIQQAMGWAQEYNRVANEIAAKQQDIAAMTKAGMSPAMIQAAKDQLAALQQRQAKGVGARPDVMEGLREKLEEQNAAIANSAKSVKAAHAAMHANDVQYWTQALAGDKLNAKERAEAQMALFNAKEAASLGALPSGRGGRGARAPTGSPDQRMSLEFQKEQAAADQDAAEQSGRQFSQGLRGGAASIEQKRAQLEAEVAADKISKEEMLSQLSAYVAEVEAADRTAFASFSATVDGYPQVWQRAHDKMLAQSQAFAVEQARITAQMAEDAKRTSKQMQEAFAKPLDSVGSSLERAATGLLTRQTTVRQAEQQGYRSLIGSGVDEIGGALNQSLSSALFGSGTKSLGQGLVGMLGIGKPGGLFGTGIGAVSADTTQATLATTLTANTAAVTANTAALTTSAGAAVSGGALSSAGGIASGAGGIASFLGSLPLIGSLFGGGAAVTSFGIPTAIAAAGAPFGFKNGGIVPSFAHGGIMPRHHRFSLPSYAAGGVAIPGLAKLHENEMVLPGNISSFVQRASAAYAGGGQPGAGGDTHFHMHNEGATILDGPSFHRWFQSNGGKQMIADTVKSAFRSNALTPRTV